MSEKNVREEKKAEKEAKEFDRSLFLSDGTLLIPDSSKISILEFRNLVDPKTDEDEGDEILGKMVGWSKEKVQNLSYDDWRSLAAKALEVCQQPPPTNTPKA